MKAKTKTAFIAAFAILDCVFGGLVISSTIDSQHSKEFDIKTSANYVVVNGLRDLSGNIKETVRDKEAPTITGSKDITIYVGDKVDFFKDIVITDNSEDELKKEVLGTYNVNKAGEYSLAYEVRDSSNNVATSNFKLIVKEKVTSNKVTKTSTNTKSKTSTSTKSSTSKTSGSNSVENSASYKAVQAKSTWNGAKLTRSKGAIQGPSGKETYYNLNMNGVISAMRKKGYSAKDYPYWVRSDGVKMFGNYVMVAANLNIRPKGTIVQTSLGLGIVCDTGGFAKKNTKQLDIATAW